jgi:hypothetical protein
MPARYSIVGTLEFMFEPGLGPRLFLFHVANTSFVQINENERCPAVMSGLASITDAPVSVVTGHDLSPMRPSVFRVLWPWFSDRLSV